MMYSLRDLYPDVLGLSTSEQSIPERAEQAAYDQDAGQPAPAPTAKAGNVWISLLVIVVLLWLFHII